MKSRIVLRRCSPRRFSFSFRHIASIGWLPFAAVVLLPLGAAISRAQLYDPRATTENAVSPSDPSELYLRAYTSVQQAEKLEEDAKLRPALAKYRFAASLLDQLSQTNPNWQPLIVRYRQRKTTESIQKLEDKGVVLANPPGPAASLSSVPGGGSYGQPTTLGPLQPVAPAGLDDDLPTPDAAPGQPMPHGTAVAVNPQGLQEPSQLAPPIEVADRATRQIGDKLNKTQKELKSALDALASAKKDKQDLIKEKEDVESKLRFSQTASNIAQKRFEHTKADRDEIQADLTKAETRLKDATTKNPAVARSRVELRDEVESLKKQLAKAQADTETASKSHDEISAKYEKSEQNVTALTKERDAAVARNELTKDAAQKIDSLQSENSSLTQKLSSAESSITKLTAESLKKKHELDGMQKELTTLKDQLASSRDQNDRSATTITELRAQLDDSAKHIGELKAKGMSSEEYTKISKENTMLRDIVMRQLKDQARRASIKQLLVEELTRLDVQSSALNAQLEELGKPSTQLTDEERSLFKDPLVNIADSDSMAATITAFRSRPPRAAPESGGTAPNAVTTPEEAPQNQPPDYAPPAVNENKSGPQVQTTSQPRVSEELLPMAREAKEDFDHGHYPEAERTYDKLLARDPKNPYLLTNQGVVLYRQDKLKSAEVMLKKAVAAAPNDPFGQATLGMVYYRMHRYDEAMRSLTQSLQNDPKNAAAHNYLGITASQKGYQAAAVDELQAALTLNPNYADAHFNLAVVYATSQPPDKIHAREHYDAAVRLGASADPTLEKLIGN